MVLHVVTVLLEFFITDCSVRVSLDLEYPEGLYPPSPIPSLDLHVTVIINARMT